jgi:hypothetical protein
MKQKEEVLTFVHDDDVDLTAARVTLIGHHHLAAGPKPGRHVYFRTRVLSTKLTAMNSSECANAMLSPAITVLLPLMPTRN